MVSPLYIDVVMTHKLDYNIVGMRASVEYVAYYVQGVDSETLYSLCKTYYKLVGTVKSNN